MSDLSCFLNINDYFVALLRDHIDFRLKGPSHLGGVHQTIRIKSKGRVCRPKSWWIIISVIS